MSTIPNNEQFEIVFPQWYDERGELEAEAKGWLQGVEVHFTDGAVFPLFFYDPVRLTEDLEAATNAGKAFIARPGLVVIPEITRAAIQQTVSKLCAGNYFNGASPRVIAGLRNGPTNLPSAEPREASPVA